MCFNQCLHYFNLEIMLNYKSKLILKHTHYTHKIKKYFFNKKQDFFNLNK